VSWCSENLKNAENGRHSPKTRPAANWQDRKEIARDDEKWKRAEESFQRLPASQPSPIGREAVVHATSIIRDGSRQDVNRGEAAKRAGGRNLGS